MNQEDNNTYQKKTSASDFLFHSCLGKLVLVLGFLLVLLIIAFFTNPSPKKMQTKMWDNIRQSIESEDPIDLDAIDVFVNNFGYTFTDADFPEDKEVCDEFRHNNDTLIFHHIFFSTMYVNNHYDMEPERCGVGIFGLVVPTANFKRFLPQDVPHSEPGQQLLPGTDNDEIFGETPVDIFTYDGE